MDLLKEAFIEGYKQRAESSNLIFDNASRMYAISLFDKWKSEQLLLHNVSQQRELLRFMEWLSTYWGIDEVIDCTKHQNIVEQYKP